MVQANEFRDTPVARLPTDADENKLLNIIYYENDYYLFEPKNRNENADNIIDNNLWLIMRFMPKKCNEVVVGDVIRFGRIPFKVTKLVLDV